MYEGRTMRKKLTRQITNS